VKPIRISRSPAKGRGEEGKPTGLSNADQKPGRKVSKGTKANVEAYPYRPKPGLARGKGRKGRPSELNHTNQKPGRKASHKGY